jgi:hypothetical protein
MVTRIRWTEQEKLGVAVAIVEYQRLFPKATLLRAIQEAQAVLPEERRRKIATRSEMPWIDGYIKKAQDSTSMDSLFAFAETPPEPAVTEEPILHLESPPAAPPEAPQLDLNAVPLEEFTKVWLSRMFNEYFRPQLDAMCEGYLAKKAAAMIEEIQVMRGEKGRVQVVVPEAVKRAIRPKVLILGLLGKQVTEIKQGYGKALNLTLIGSDHNHDGLIPLAKSHDIGIVMTRFVNHSQQDQIRNNAPHTIMVSGATTDLSNILNSIIHEGDSKVRQHNFSSKTFAH